MANYIEKLFGTLISPENIQRMQQNLPLEFPEAMENSFLTYMLERSYLEDVADNHQFKIEQSAGWKGGWLKIKRIPVHPSNEETYDLLARWQATLTTLHTWNEKVVFILKRQSGHTCLYIGCSGVSLQKAQERGETALGNNMPGIDVEKVDAEEMINLIKNITTSSHVGAVTGIPSFREKTHFNVLQTLDQIAFGIRDYDGEESNFTLMVIADPIKDEDTAEIIRRYQKMGSDIHTDVRHTLGETTQVGQNRQATLGIGALLADAGKVASGLAGVPFVGDVLGYVIGGANVQNSTSINFSRNTGSDTLNKFAEYTEKLTDMHAERLRNGRSQGFWNAGVYVLGNRETDVNTILGMLRSIYSGDQSFIEPIRIHQFCHDAVNSIKENLLKMNLVPILRPDMNVTEDEWHVLGRNYQYLSTPVNTSELSLMTSLPRKDVPGLRFVKTAVRFANNPGSNLGHELLRMGHIIDTGVEQRNEYKIDVHSLVRHSLIVGGTGCGKTTTCKTIINDVLSKGIHVLIIEPAKDEYVRWALEQRKRGKQVNIFMPGQEGEEFSRLKLNPFQPAAIEGAPIDMLSRCEQFTALINASLPASDVLPVLIDETFYTFLKEQPFGYDFMNGEMSQLDDYYPKLDGLTATAKDVMNSRGYSDEVSRGLSAALETRFNYLTRGKRGRIMNVNYSTSWDKLFKETTVVNLSKLASTKDKSLIMSLLMLALYEYRISAYTYDDEYRKKAQSNRLQHLTVVEEAHNVLTKPNNDVQGTGNPQQVVADLFGNMLSEIRSYGEGLMIVDQVPTRLIPDAIKNTNYKIVHRMTAPDDCEVMEAALALRPEQRGIIPLLAQGQVLVAGDRDDAASWVKIHMPKINL